MNTIIEQIKAEVEKRLKNTRDYMNGAGMKYKGPKYHASRGRESAYDAILSFISTLESEKPINPADAMKEIEEKIALVKQRGTWDGVDVDKYMDEVRGREPEKPMDGLEEEVEREWNDCDGKHSDTDYHIVELTKDDFLSIARHFAQWGVEQARDQMMKEAVEGEYGYFSNASKTILPSGKLNIKEGDKVRIIVCKNED